MDEKERIPGINNTTSQQEDVGPQAGNNIPVSEKVAQNDKMTVFSDEENAQPQTKKGGEKWNSSKRTIFKFIAINTSFIIMGMNDACVGALLPYIEEYYTLTYTTVATLFIVPAPGYLLAALTNSHIHHKFGQRGVAFLGPFCRLIGYIPLASHPSFYPILPILFVATGFGNGIEDSAWNAWVGSMDEGQVNQLLGFLHGSYGLGATISPLIASAMVAKGGLGWWTFFYIMIALSAVQIVLSTSAFWGETGEEYKKALAAEENASSGRVTTRTVLKKPLPWFFAIFLFLYVGSEVALGGWITTFMLRVRDAEPFLAGVSVTLYWMGLTLGRVVLGFVTPLIGVKLALAIYLLLCVVFEILYWLVPSFAAAVVFVIFLGFFLGPMFPGAVVVATKILPKEEHVSAIGFAAAFGGAGAAVFPFAVGAIAESKGVAILQPFVLAMIGGLLLVWLILPGGVRKDGLDKARENGTQPGEDLLRVLKKATRRS